MYIFAKGILKFTCFSKYTFFEIAGFKNSDFTDHFCFENDQFYYRSISVCLCTENVCSIQQIAKLHHFTAWLLMSGYMYIGTGICIVYNIADKYKEFLFLFHKLDSNQNVKKSEKKNNSINKCTNYLTQCSGAGFLPLFCLLVFLHYQNKTLPLQQAAQ